VCMVSSSILLYSSPTNINVLLHNVFNNSSSIQDETLDYLCSNNTNLVCNTRKSSKVLGTLKLTRHNIPYEFKYRQPDNSTGKCQSKPELGAWVDTCMLRTIEGWCKMLVPPPTDCVTTFLGPLNDEVAAFNNSRWTKTNQDHYHVLGLTRDASMLEIDLAFRSLMIEKEGNVVPFAPFYGNLSDPNYYWDDIANDRFRISQAYKDLHDPEQREFWDQVRLFIHRNFSTLLLNFVCILSPVSGYLAELCVAGEPRMEGCKF
jgi:hypothetical protein